MTRYQLIFWSMETVGRDDYRAALNDLLGDARRVGEDKHQVELHAQSQLLRLRYSAGEDVEEELRSLLAAASQARGKQDVLTLGLLANLMTVKLKKGDREAGTQLRALLPVFASRLGEAHQVTRQIRENLSR